MSPAPDLSEENIILNPLPTTAVLAAISSSDELDHHAFDEHRMDLGLVVVFLFSLSVVACNEILI